MCYTKKDSKSLNLLVNDSVESFPMADVSDK